MKETRVKVGQIELQVQEHEREGDAIVFLHFSGANLVMWQRALPHFQERYHLVLLDMRGHGKSDRPETGYHMDDMAGDVVGMLQNLGLQRAHIVGSSLGAEVGLSIAANHPENVISLVCEGPPTSECGPYSTWEGSEKDFEEHVTRQLENMRHSPETIFPTIEALVDNRRQVLDPLGWWNVDVEAVIRHGAYELGEAQYVRVPRKQAMIEYVGHYYRARFEDYYSRVKCPMLFVVSEEDWGDEREKVALEAMANLAGQAEVVPVGGWEHPYGWMLDPEPVSNVILKFLAATADLR